jgi:HEAT repeat protein
LAGRSSPQAGAAGQSALANPDAAVRREALALVRRFGTVQAIKPLIQLIAGATDAERTTTEAALVEICRRHPAALEALGTEITPSTRPVKIALLGVLGSTGDPRAIAPIRAQLGSEDAEVRLAAVRSLAEWPDPTPFEDLARVVENGADARERLLAARGLNRMAPQDPQRAGRAAAALAGALTLAGDTASRRTLMAALAGIPSLPSLNAIRPLLRNPDLATEAASALIGIGEAIYPWHTTEVQTALTDIRGLTLPAELTSRLAALAARLALPANFALGALVSSPDGLDKDGASNGDAAAADGRPETYWDELDGQKLYVLRLQLREPSPIGCLRILGWTQHDYAPKDFEILGNGRTIKTVTNAQYTSNWFTVAFPPVECTVVELKITSYYGQSPAIRELELYRTAPNRQP